jgi:hypothetical protein
LGGDFGAVLGRDFVELSSEDIAGDGAEAGANGGPRKWVPRLAPNDRTDARPGKSPRGSSPVGVIGRTASGREQGE